MLKYLHLKCIYQTTGKENLQIYLSGKAGSTSDWGTPQIHVQYMTISTTSNQRFPTSIFIFPLGLQIGKYEECKDRRMLSTLYDAGAQPQKCGTMTITFYDLLRKNINENSFHMSLV